MNYKTEKENTAIDVDEEARHGEFEKFVKELHEKLSGSTDLNNKPIPYDPFGRLPLLGRLFEDSKGGSKEKIYILKPSEATTGVTQRSPVRLGSL